MNSMTDDPATRRLDVLNSQLVANSSFSLCQGQEGQLREKGILQGQVEKQIQAH